jgi:hypothetical protein
MRRSNDIYTSEGTATQEDLRFVPVVYRVSYGGRSCRKLRSAIVSENKC